MTREERLVLVRLSDVILALADMWLERRDDGPEIDALRDALEDM